MYYWVVIINNWDGGDRTWKTELIFKEEKSAQDFYKQNKNQLLIKGFESESIVRRTFQEYK